MANFCVSLAKPCGPPPPGPPPPAASLMQAAPAAKTAAPDTNALFAALNKGDCVTTGLKKVTKDMQTHKNPALRAGGVVKTVEKPVAEPKNQPAQKKQLPPKGPVLEGNKWVIVSLKFFIFFSIASYPITYL
jgi:adenylyl cyclase-associated protein